jgi:hypothetical protein
MPFELSGDRDPKVARFNDYLFVGEALGRDLAWSIASSPIQPSFWSE